MNHLRSWLPWLAAPVVISAGVALIDPRGAFWPAFGGYLAVCLLGAVLLRAGWRATIDERTPRAVLVAVLTGLALRLVVGLGLQVGLPDLGYDTVVQNAGYVYHDAYARDSDAWARGRSDLPLSSAFLDRRVSDQYGGLLFISAAAYRYLSEGVHRPLLITLLAVAVSTLAILFGWGFAAMTLGKSAGVLAAWILALYPEAVLLGASQMREAFTIPGLGLALLGYALLRLGRQSSGMLAIVLGIGLVLFLSPPFGLSVALLVGGLWLIENRLSSHAVGWVLAGIAGLAVLGLALTWLAWSSVGGLPDSGPFGLLVGWFDAGAAFQLSELERGSGWVQKLFELTPSWAHMPLATAYGLSQPLLPAALADNSGAPIWQAIAIWRAVGWYALMPLLLYGAVAAFGAERRRRLLGFLAVVVWLVALLASFRAAGDQWDNPRYRAALIVPQAVLAAWAFAHARRRSDPWLARTIWLVAGPTVLMLHWYLGRYYGTPRFELFPTLGLVLIWVIGVVVIGLWRDRRRLIRAGLTGGSAEV